MTPSLYVDNCAASEAVFGSHARGDTDCLSDRDFLIVDDSTEVLKIRANALRREGASVASYTFRKLEALIKKQALFVQHLRLEASICIDLNCRLERLLTTFQPKINYDSEIRGNANLAGLITTIPDSRRAELWAADILYVAVRNFGVLWLAGRRRYVFAYDQILQALCQEGVIAASGVSALRELRVLKSIYRSNIPCISVGPIDTIRAALEVLPRAFFPATSQIVSPIEVLSQPGPPEGSAAYLCLRDLEKRMVATQSYVKSEVAEPELKMINRWICNPRAYANISAIHATRLRKKLLSIAEELRYSRDVAPMLDSGKPKR
jgi:predicted nucleotidyltransferase